MLTMTLCTRVTHETFPTNALQNILQYRTIERLSVFHTVKCEDILGLQSYCYIVIATATATLTETNQTKSTWKYTYFAHLCAQN